MAERRSLRRFNGENSTPEYRHAIGSLQVLNRDQAQRAYGEYRNSVILDDFEKKYVECSGAASVKRLKTKDHSWNCATYNVPGGEHCSLWRRKGEEQPSLFVMQLYNLSMECFKNLIGFCEDNNLAFHVESANSWHFSG